MKWMSCEEVKDKFSLDIDCCLSCHENYDEFPGFYEIEIYFEEDCAAIVCCHVLNALEARNIAARPVPWS